MTTAEWARSLGIADTPLAPSVLDYHESCARTAEQIAGRILVLQGVVAVGCRVEPDPIVAWFKEQNLWCQTSPLERGFLEAQNISDQHRFEAHWRQEAEWALLWCIGKVDALGLPTQTCDTARLVDDIIPPLGSDISAFVASAILRTPGELLAEDDRSYNLWCYVHAARRKRNPLPDDLNWHVLYQRRYAFEWLDGNQQWDEVTCDA